MTHHGARSPKSDPEAQAMFRRLVPDDERVTTRPMFGSLAAFANGYMFMGLFGPELFVRLPEAEREAQASTGWQNLEPMSGKPMREYLVIPGEWRSQPELVRSWGSRALDYVMALAPKK
jgi:TfoX/Sxy family transcriptional regulator of competence genes